MDVTVQQLRCFVAVADELSFTRAASRLSLSPSTVSEQVSTLERRLGLGLFVRTSRRVTPTPSATALLPLARRAVDGIDDVVAWAQGADSHPQVTIGVMASSARFRGLIEVSRRELPEVDWRIRQMSFNDPFDALRRRDLDCAFVAELAPPPSSGDIRSYSLWQERLLVAVRENHELARGPSAEMADLSDQSLICGPGGMTNGQWFSVIYALVPGEPRVLNTAHNLEEVVEMCATGIGVTVVTESALEMFHRPGLAYVPLRDAPRATTRLHVRNQDPSRALAGLVAIARERHPARVSGRSG